MCEEGNLFPSHVRMEPRKWQLRCVPYQGLTKRIKRLRKRERNSQR